MSTLFFKLRKNIKPLASIMILAMICGCKESKVKKGSQSEEVLVYSARKQLTDDKYQAAIEPLTQLTNNYQVSANAQTYKQELMHAQFKSGNYMDCIETADAFFSLYPFEPSSDYALYMKVKASFGEFKSRHWMPRSIREKYGYANSEILKDAIVSANLLMTNYPKSQYIGEVISIKNQMREVLLKRDYNIADHYRKKHAYVASQKRLSDVVTNTNSKSLLQKALVMTKANFISMKQPEEAEKVEKLIQANWSK